MSATQEQLVKAASPDFAAAVAAAGGAGSISGLVDAAQAEQLKKVTEAVVSDAVTVLNGIDTIIHNNTVQVAKLQAEIDKLNEASAKANTAKLYFKHTNNLFPARKLIGLPTNRDILAINPKIDEVPKDWAAPEAAPAATSAA